MIREMKSFNYLSNKKSWVAAAVLSLYSNRLTVGKRTVECFLFSKLRTGWKRNNQNNKDRNRYRHRMMTTMSELELVDVDCNLLHSDLRSLKKKTEVVTIEDDAWNILHEDAVKEAKIVAMISPSSTIAETEQFLNLYQSHPPSIPIRVKTTVGVHPYHVNDNDLIYDATDERISMEEHRNKISTILMKDEENNISAVGECGLDASEGFPPLELQLPWFLMQIEIATQFKLPLFVHERLAFPETIKMLEIVPPTSPIIIHCFTGTKENCIEYIKRGYYISISGYILNERNDNYSEVISCLEEGIIPLDKLMIETDSPYMGFKGCRQLYLDHNHEYVSSINSKSRKRLQQSIYPNVPSSLPMVLSKVTECLQKHDTTLTLEKIALCTTANARKFFSL